MKSKTLMALASGAIAILSPNTHATFVGMTTESYSTTIVGNARTVWRVYANFTSGIEGVYSIGPIGAKMSLQTYAGPDPNGPVSGQFFAGGNPTVPSMYDIENNPNAAHRSFYTINLTVADQSPDWNLWPVYNISMPTITGNTVTAPSASSMTTTTPSAPFALASWDGQNRVLILQLQVTSGNHVRGKIGMRSIDEQVFVGTFNSILSPGALMPLFFAALSASRRRRD